jgi:hypothetical protein
LHAATIALSGGRGCATEHGASGGTAPPRAPSARQYTDRSTDDGALRSVRVQSHFFGALHDAELHARILSDPVRHGFASGNRDKHNNADPQTRSVRQGIAHGTILSKSRENTTAS